MESTDLAAVWLTLKLASIVTVLLLIVGTPVNGFAPNLNVIATSVSALPSASEITSQLVGLGATDVTVTPTTTAVGDAFVTSYAITAGTTTAFGGQIGLTTPTGSALVSVTTSSGALTSKILVMCASATMLAGVTTSCLISIAQH